MTFQYRLSITALPDPYPIYRSMRDDDPSHYSEVEDLWVLTRFDDCLAALADWKTWSSERRGNLVNDIPERIGKTLGTTDPPRHTIVRQLINKGFTPKVVADLEPTIRATARRLSQRARDLGTFEYVHEIAAPLNAFVLGALFGIPEADFVQLRRWLDDFFLREEAEPGREPRQVVAMRALRTYVDALATERRKAPGDDLLSAMIAAEDAGVRLSHEQIVVTTLTFLGAGFESANNLFTNMVHALYVNPDVLREVQSDLALVPAFAEETMRWDSAAQGFVRSPTRDVALHGKLIPEGAQVYVHYGAANRDDRRFDAPDRFDLHRPRPRHLGLGHSTHFCIGAPLSRVMARVAFEELLPLAQRWDVDLDTAIRVTTPNFRGFFRLDMAI
ncbi:MAG: cytochrome P450 [Chloroflexi bacterium]|nr:cytochrome P450 [Chloroflexota bacterium]